MDITTGNRLPRHVVERITRLMDEKGDAEQRAYVAEEEVSRLKEILCPECVSKEISSREDNKVH